MYESLVFFSDHCPHLLILGSNTVKRYRRFCRPCFSHRAHHPGLCKIPSRSSPPKQLAHDPCDDLFFWICLICRLVWDQYSLPNPRSEGRASGRDLEVVPCIADPRRDQLQIDRDRVSNVDPRDCDRRGMGKLCLGKLLELGPKETWSSSPGLSRRFYMHGLQEIGGRKAAILSIVGFVAVLFTFGVNYLLSGLHSYL
jgi:hypothetical protein